MAMAKILGKELGGEDDSVKKLLLIFFFLSKKWKCEEIFNRHQFWLMIKQLKEI